MKSTRKGLTLMEMVVVMLIIGVLIAVALPSYYNSIWQSKVQGVENNLKAISAAQQKFSEDYNSSYCLNSGANPANLTPTCGDSLVDLNTNLYLNMAVVNDGFQYYCDSSLSPFLCTAYNNTTNIASSMVSKVTIDVNGNITCYNGVTPLNCP